MESMIKEAGVAGEEEMQEEVAAVEEMAASLARIAELENGEKKHGIASCKIVFLMELLDNLIAEGHRVLIFSQTRKMLNIIQKNSEIEMDFVQCALNLTLPPIAVAFLSVMLPLLALMRMLFWSYHLIFRENMRGKTVLITGASSRIGESQQMAYCYAKKGANLMLVARRKDRLRAVAEKSLSLRAKNVHVIAADVTQEEDCKRFIEETINIYGCCKSPF